MPTVRISKLQRNGDDPEFNDRKEFAMKALFACALAGLVVASIGCNQQTPGGPGAVQAPGASNPPTSTTANRPTYGEAPKSFEVNVPLLATRIKQGESATATISLSRGLNFDEDVTLTIAELPAGITVDPPAPIIKRGDQDVTLTFHAAADAGLGDFSVKLMGHPSKGPDATSDFKFTVVKK